jgi:hypothetical protein
MERNVIKATLLGRLHDAYMQVQDGLAQLTTTQIGTPNSIRDWSVKDLIAHLIAHEQRALQELRAAVQGEQFVIDHTANDSFNAGAVAASRPCTTDAILHAWHQSFHEVIATVEGLPDELFYAPHPITNVLDDTIDGALANNTYAHYQEHLADIEREIEYFRT